MAKNTGRGTRSAVSPAREEPQASSNGLWVRRNPLTGRFTEAKRTGGAFKGARRGA